MTRRWIWLVPSKICMTLASYTVNQSVPELCCSLGQSREAHRRYTPGVNTSSGHHAPAQTHGAVTESALGGATPPSCPVENTAITCRDSGPVSGRARSAVRRDGLVRKGTARTRAELGAPGALKSPASIDHADAGGVVE